MENIKFSFIVPVYNVAPYLRKCVDSLLVQDIHSSKYEIIMVDDGSTDNSSQICDEYAATHENIRVVHQKNGGLSAARNAGLKIAKGEYICFVDSDDYWEENVLGGLMVQIERGSLDVLRFNYRNVNERYEEFYPNKDPKRDVDFSEKVTDGETFLNERLGPGCYAVMFIIKRGLILNTDERKVDSEYVGTDVLFTEGIYFEDVDWTPRMLIRAKRVASTPHVVYNYLWRTGSITQPTDPAKRKKVLDDKMRLIRGFKEQCKLVHDPKWFIWMTSSTVIGILSVIAHSLKEEKALYINKLKSMQVFPLSTVKEKKMSHKIKIVLVNISPDLYCFIIGLRK